MQSSSKKGGFASGLGFVLASAGSAVGLGNLWGFPYKTADNGGARWAVRCDCGVCFTTSARNLVHGGTRSCGCLRRDMLRNNPGRNTKRVRI